MIHVTSNTLQFVVYWLHLSIVKLWLYKYAKPHFWNSAKNVSNVVQEEEAYVLCTVSFTDICLPNQQNRSISPVLRLNFSCLIHIRLNSLSSDLIPSFFVDVYNALSISLSNMFDFISLSLVAFVLFSSSSVRFSSSLKCFCLLAVILFRSPTGF